MPTSKQSLDASVYLIGLAAVLATWRDDNLMNVTIKAIAAWL
jgi:hypothetical protein